MDSEVWLDRKRSRLEDVSLGEYESSGEGGECVDKLKDSGEGKGRGSNWVVLLWREGVVDAGEGSGEYASVRLRLC